MIGSDYTKENQQIIENVGKSLNIDQVSAINLLILLGFEALNLNSKANQLVEAYCGDKVLKKIKKGTTKAKAKVTPPPFEWVEYADNGWGPPESKLVSYGQQHGFTIKQINSMFANFINYQIKKGNKWKDWNRAWYDWVRRQKEFGLSFDKNRGNIRPATFKQL